MVATGLRLTGLSDSVPIAVELVWIKSQPTVIREVIDTITIHIVVADIPLTVIVQVFLIFVGINRTIIELVGDSIPIFILDDNDVTAIVGLFPSINNRRPSILDGRRLNIRVKGAVVLIIRDAIAIDVLVARITDAIPIQICLVRIGNRNAEV
jgi:hypothetical protein